VEAAGSDTIDALRKTLREQLKAARALEIATFQGEGRVERLTQALSGHVDQALQEAWRALRLPAGLALAAVGGYGRGELFPYSDCDLLILLPGAPDAHVTAQLEQLVQLFWDLGLEIGHSIRTVDECLSEAEADITVQTSLLEARLIAGDQARCSR
jgi:[protein-PII] uridylyltransferase